MGSALVAASRLRDVIPVDRAQRAAFDVSARAGGDVQETRWRGASRVLRGMESWVASIGSAVSDLPAHEQRTMRARSRDAFRSNMIARAALTRSRTAIVGTGLLCRPNVDRDALGLTEEAATELNASLRARWEGWAENALECDAEATLDFYGLQGLALLSAMASGDVFALTPSERRPGCLHELKVQLVEADRASNPHDGVDTETRVDGVELRGVMPVGYWVRNTHPGDHHTTTMAAWQLYPAFGELTGRRRVLHVWNDKERPSQVRGAPYLAPILEPLKQLDRFGGAELMAAVVSAMVTVFIEREAEQTDANGNPAEAFELDENGNVALGNAAIVDLAPGEKANLANPSRPNANFDPFFMAIVKQIGAALEVPVDTLLLHYQSSYSAARAAMLEAWRFFHTRRWTLTQQFCVPIYGLWLDEEVATGRLRLPGYGDPARRRAYSRATWIGPAKGAMDEDKEARAARTRIEIGISNEAIETAQMTGEDWHDVHTQRVREINQRKKDGTWIPPRGDREATPAPQTTEDANA